MSGPSFGLIVIFLLTIYVLPTVVAFGREHPNRWLILGINLFLGETVFVWFICLIWALQAIHLPDDDGSAGGESGLNLFVNDETRVRVVGVEPATAPLIDMRPVDYIEKLSQLKDLRDGGVLSDEEFALMKQRLLAEQSLHS